jgi:NDP-sugar pyrophosphorylase family protein
MQAIVLAGGLGTRLRSVVTDLPKPMASVAGRPFLAWILDRLAHAGFGRVVLAVGHRHEIIEQHFGQAWRGVVLQYSVEAQPLGTGGAIRPAAFVTEGLFVDIGVPEDYARAQQLFAPGGAAQP